MFNTTSKITSYEDTPLKEFERNSIISCIMINLNESKTVIFYVTFESTKQTLAEHPSYLSLD